MRKGRFDPIPRFAMYDLLDFLQFVMNLHDVVGMRWRVRPTCIFLFFIHVYNGLMMFARQYQILHVLCSTSYVPMSRSSTVVRSWYVYNRFMTKKVLARHYILVECRFLRNANPRMARNQGVSSSSIHAKVSHTPS